MGQISLNEPVVGQPDATEDPKIPSNFTILQTLVNGNLDASNVSAALAQSATVNQSGQTVKGAVNIPNGQATSSTSYGLLATADRVSGIVLPTNGLIVVWYKALMSVTGAGVGYAAPFLNSTQVVGGGQGAPTACEAVVDGSVVNGHVVTDTRNGIVAMANTGAPSTDVTTGQLIAASSSGGGGGVNLAPGGGPAFIFASAGTYSVSVQYKVSVNTVTATASNRHLWVLALSFA